MQASTKRQIILINCLSRLNVSSSSMPHRERERPEKNDGQNDEKEISRKNEKQMSIAQ